MEEMQKEGFVLKADKPKGKKKKKKQAKTENDAKPKVVNILEESQEVDLQELAKRDQQLLEQRKMLFRDVDCEYSCYIFSKVS